MKKIILISTLLAGVSLQPALAEDIKLGILFGFTGPIESVAANMGPAAELAIKEVSDSGGLLNGAKVSGIRADSTCSDSAAAERLITADKVSAIIGADCSGVTTAVLQNVAMPNGIVMISPSAATPALSTIKDNGLFFRTSASDARQGEIVADILNEKGVQSIAITYTNNDYGKGLSESIAKNFSKTGGKVTINIAHEDTSADHAADVATLAAAGGEVLVVAGYLDQGGKAIIQASLDSGAFSTFYLPSGMVGDTLPQAIGSDLNGSYGASPGTNSKGAKQFTALAKANNFEAGPFTAESYDAAALMLLAMQAAGSASSEKLKDKVMQVANAPGEKIFPGELGKALKIIAEGGDIDYVGASAVELIGSGESAGNYREIKIEGGKVVTVNYR